MLLQCVKLLELSLDERKEVLKQSGLCLYCLKHAAEMKCYGRGGFSKPKCRQSGCDGEHAVGAHKLLGGSGTSVNLVAEDGYESEEDEEWWVSTVRVEEEGKEEEEENMEEIDDSESERNGEREIRYFTSTHVRKDDSGLEDELEYFWEAPSPSDPYEREEDRWWSQGLRSPALRKTRKRSGILPTYWGSGPKRTRSRRGSLLSRRGWRQAPKGAAGRRHQGGMLNRAGNHQGPHKAWNCLVQRGSKGGNSERR